MSPIAIAPRAIRRVHRSRLVVRSAFRARSALPPMQGHDDADLGRGGDDVRHNLGFRFCGHRRAADRCPAAPALRLRRTRSIIKRSRSFAPDAAQLAASMPHAGRYSRPDGRRITRDRTLIEPKSRAGRPIPPACTLDPSRRARRKVARAAPASRQKIPRRPRLLQPLDMADQFRDPHRDLG